MSSDQPTVTLLGDAMVPLVKAAAMLQAARLPPFAVIGGLAVAVRLGRALRATADLDAVTDYRCSPGALDILRARHGIEIDPADPHTINLAGTEVQFQDVAAVTDDELRGLAPPNRLYVASHAHALTTAEIVRIRAETPTAAFEAEVPVATTGALVAMKLHAYLDRRSSCGPDKRPGDLWDIYNLLQFAAAEAAPGPRHRQPTAQRCRSRDPARATRRAIDSSPHRASDLPRRALPIDHRCRARTRRNRSAPQAPRMTEVMTRLGHITMETDLHYQHATRDRNRLLADHDSLEVLVIAIADHRRADTGDVGADASTEG